MNAELSKKYSKAKSLTEFDGDPESNPFLSKYQARKLFQDIRDDLHCQRENDDCVSLM